MYDLDEDEVEHFGCFAGDWWVIPHRSSLDYCRVRVTSESADRHGRVFVEGCRTEGWTPDRANIRTRVPIDKLTRTPSHLEPFKDLYDDPCIPERR